MDNKIDFIAAAINDTQSTIRATDVKVGVLLTGVLLPLSSLGSIWPNFVTLSSVFDPWVGLVTGLIFFFLWLIVVITLVKTISAIDNPSAHIVNSNDFKGSFYGGGLYQFSFIDSLINRSIIKANKDVLRIESEYPDSKDAITTELSYEHMKLIYIREIKLFRLNFALKTSLLWLLTGISVYIVSKVTS